MSTTLSPLSSDLSPSRSTVRIRMADQPRYWASLMIKAGDGHEFHFVRSEQHARRFDAADAEMIVADENRRRLFGKLEIVRDGEMRNKTQDSGLRTQD
jgi:hypothetical protein